MHRPLIFSCLTIFVAAAGTEAAVDGGRSAGNLDSLVELLGEVDDVAFQRDVLQGMHKALDGRRDVTTPAGWSKLSPALLRSKDGDVRRLTLQIGVIFGDPHAMTELRKRASDARRKPAERIAALGPLVQSRDAKTLPLLFELLEDKSVRGAAIRRLAAYRDSRTPDKLLELYPRLGESEKSDAQLTLASRPPFALKLLEAVEKKQIPSRDVSAFVVRQMTALGDKRVNDRVKQVWGDVRPTSESRRKLIASFKKRLNPKTLQKADRVKGRVVYRKTCASCHRLFDDGKRIGPELTGSQRNNLDYLLENLLDPNAVIGRDYRMTVLVTNGRVVTGVIKEETAKTLTVQTANEQIVVAKADVEIRKRSPVSMMPEGQIEKLPFADVRDLFGYLMGSSQVPLSEEEPGGR